MSENNIDRIALEIESHAGKSTNGIDDLIVKLQNLKRSTKGVSRSLNSVSKSLNGLSVATKRVNAINFTGLQRGLNSIVYTVNRVNRAGGDIASTTKNLKGLSGALNSSRKSITTLASSSKELRKADISGFTKNMMELAKLGRYTGEMIKFKDATGALNRSLRSLEKSSTVLQQFINNISKLENLDNFQAKINKLTPSLNQLATAMTNAKNASQGFNKTTRGSTNALNNMSNMSNMKNMSNRFGMFGVNLGGISKQIFSIYALSRALGYTFAKANDYIETLNLFNVVMGTSTKKAWNFISSLEMLGVDMEQAMRYQASFYDISKSMGLAEQNAYTLSEQFTKLTYDYASLYNMNLDDSFQKLQSAITGELEPIRRLGKDISETRLQQVALNLGISESVRTMSQAEKAELRFIAVMQQSGAAMNDMERTINQPANALRVLRAQFVSLARDLGNLFIPIITAVLPYLIAFVRVIRTLISAIAGLFGIENSFTLDFNQGNSIGISDDYLRDMAGNSADVADNSDRTSKSTGKTAKNLKKSKDALKKMKDFATGIDELNILKPDTPTPNNDTSSGGSGGGGTGGGGAGGIGGGGIGGGDGLGLDLSKFGYEDVLKDVSMKADEIYDKFMKWKTPLLIIASILGGIFAINKLAKFIDYLAKTKMNFLKIKAVIGALIQKIPGLATVVGFLRNTLGRLGGTILSVFGISGASSTVALITGVGVALAAVAAAAVLVYKGMQPAIEQVDEFANVSETTKEKLEPVIKTWKSLDSQILKLDWSNKVITQNDVAEITHKVHDMVESVLDEVSSDRNEALNDIELLADLEGVSDETYQNMLNQTNKYYNNISNETKTAEKKINQILRTAKNEKRDLTKDEVRQLRYYQEQIRNNAVTTMSESEEEQMMIMTRLKHNKKALTVESASELLQEAKKNKNDQIAEAEDWRTRMLAQLDKNFGDQATMSNKEYAKQVTAIDKQYNKMKKEAEDGYDDINKEVKNSLGDQYKYIDKQTGKIKSKFRVFLDGVGGAFHTAFSGLKNWFKTWWKGFKSEWSDSWNNLKTDFSEITDKLKEWWGDIKDAFSDWKDDFKKGWDEFWEKIFSDEPPGSGNTWWDEMPFGSSNGQNEVPSMMRVGIAPTPTLTAFARGGFIPNRSGFISPDAWTAGEAGKELIGTYKGRTTVMPLENTSFVSAIHDAVYDAVKSAEKDKESTFVVKNNIKLDSKDISKGQDEYKYKSGTGLIKKK